MFVQRSV